MYFFEIEASNAIIDPADYIWYQYLGQKKTFRGKHNRHNPVFEKGTIFGIRQTRSKTPTFQVRILHESNIPYRNFSSTDIKTLEKSSALYKERIELPDFSDRQRAPKKSIKQQRKPNRNTDNIFSPKNIVEEDTIDLENYQWRKVKQPTKITARKSGKLITTLGVGDIVGVRFFKPSLGAYIILEGDVRKNIATFNFEELVESSEILPTSYQRKGEVSLRTEEQAKKFKEGKEKAKKARTSPKVEKEKEKVFTQPTRYNVDDVDLDQLEDQDLSPITRSVKRQIDKIDELEWDDDDFENLDTVDLDDIDEDEDEDLEEYGESDAYLNNMLPEDSVREIELGSFFLVGKESYMLTDIRRSKDNKEVLELFFVKGKESDFATDEIPDVDEIYVLWVNRKSKMKDFVKSGLKPTGDILDIDYLDTLLEQINSNSDSIEIQDLMP